MPLITVWNSGFTPSVHQDFEHTLRLISSASLRKHPRVNVHFFDDCMDDEGTIFIVVDLPTLSYSPRLTKKELKHFAREIGVMFQYQMYKSDVGILNDGRSRKIKVIVRRFSLERDAFWTG